jgi:hypothetical protein
MAPGRCNIEVEEYSMANGKWQMANGEWQMANGRWRMADGGEGRNRTHLPEQGSGTTILKTARATRHPSLSMNQIRYGQTSADRSGELIENRSGREDWREAVFRSPREARRAKAGERERDNLEMAGSAPGANGAEDCVGLGEFAGLHLGVDEFPVDGDLEFAAAGGGEGERLNVLFEPQEFFRQTDGLRFVVSNAAIFDGDLQWHKRMRGR